MRLQRSERSWELFNSQKRRGEVVSPHKDLRQNILLIAEDITKTLDGVTPPLRKPILGQMVAYFKYQSTKEMNVVDNSGTITKFWQRNYYEHIIRNEKELKQKTDYLLDNPSRWDDDQENPKNKKSPGSS